MSKKIEARQMEHYPCPECGEIIWLNGPEETPRECACGARLGLKALLDAMSPPGAPCTCPACRRERGEIV